MTKPAGDNRRVQRGPGEPGRRPLTRAAILQASLRLIDQQGLAAFTVRKLAQELGVDPMALYRHFANKDALLDGLSDTLWAEIELPHAEANWEATLRSVATSLWSLARTHPHAYPLLFNRQTFPLGMLRLFDGVIERLQRAGFEQKNAAAIACAVLSFAMGYALMELSTGLPEASPPAATEHAVPAMAEIGLIAQIMQRLPRETPARMVEVAYALAGLGAEGPFTLGLDLMLAGLASRQRQP
jgi:AcrR family transcriptional regulator